MSSAKRRRKAQIARFIKMDATYSHLYLAKSKRRDPVRSLRFWHSCIVALGDALEKKKPGAWASLTRHKSGSEVLIHNFDKRQRHGTQ